MAECLITLEVILKKGNVDEVLNGRFSAIFFVMLIASRTQARFLAGDMRHKPFCSSPSPIHASIQIPFDPESLHSGHSSAQFAELHRHDAR
jgi:hypothetical protein